MRRKTNQKSKLTQKWQIADFAEKEKYGRDKKQTPTDKTYNMWDKKKNTMDEINDLLDIEEKANKLEDIATEMLQTEIRGERQKKSQDYQWVIWQAVHQVAKQTFNHNS